MPGPDPAVAAVRHAVRRVVAQVPEGSLLLAACSGGADSVALLSALAWEAPRAARRSGVVHVDHRLAPGSGEVARRVVALAKELGVDVVTTAAVDVDTAGRDGPEGAARAARYRALSHLAVESQAALVLLGHTLDDQAETVLLGLARGSGTRSLAGMPQRRAEFARPLLAVRRAQTRGYCDALGLPVWDDPANADHAFARNRVRAVVLPALEAEIGPGIAEALARSADQLRVDADALDAIADAAYVVCAAGRADQIELSVEALESMHAAVRRRVLLRAAVSAGTPAGALGAVHLGAAERLVTDWHGQGPVHLPGGFAVTRRYATLHVGPGPSPLE
ncbi:MAG: tRNA lysidine(34) synthetase TilS [Mycobacteriales bacterium]